MSKHLYMVCFYQSYICCISLRTNIGNHTIQSTGWRKGQFMRSSDFLFIYKWNEVQKGERKHLHIMRSHVHMWDLAKFTLISLWTKPYERTGFSLNTYAFYVKFFLKTKRRRSDPVLWQKPLYQQKCQRGIEATQTTPQKSSIKQQLRTDLRQSVVVTTATQLCG